MNWIPFSYRIGHSWKNLRTIWEVCAASCGNWMPTGPRRRPAKSVGMSMSRVEAFSDGVIAVAITLLVLNIDVPHLKPGETLAHGLADQWPFYAAYVTSFLTIGIIWVNHHVMIGRLRETDHAILFMNLLLLMSIAGLPFATSLMAA